MRLLTIRFTRSFIMLLFNNDFSEVFISHKIIISPQREVLRRAGCSSFTFRLWLELTASFFRSVKSSAKVFCDF